MKTLIRNGIIIGESENIRGAALLFENGRISGTVSPDCTADKVIDAGGCYISPGFIDIHTHGAGGSDFMDATPEAFLNAAKMHAIHGTTALCPTTLSGDYEETLRVFDAYEKAKAQNRDGAAFIGLHLEGPYFALSQKGAQDEKYIRPPLKEEYKKILAATNSVVRWSAAPETDAGYEFAKTLTEKGILASAGHTDADFDTLLEAFENGYTHITHLYSCMTGVHRRNAYRTAGAVEGALYCDGMTVEIIADGKHLPPALLKFIYKIKGSDKIALVTDSMRGAGMSEGESILGSLSKGQKVFVEQGVAFMPDRQAFAGSVATADLLVRNMIKLADVPLREAVKMATQTPAKIIGCKTKGILHRGFDADIVIFDEDINIRCTIVGGETVYIA